MSSHEWKTLPNAELLIPDQYDRGTLRSGRRRIRGEQPASGNVCNERAAGVERVDDGEAALRPLSLDRETVVSGERALRREGDELQEARERETSSPEVERENDMSGKKTSCQRGRSRHPGEPASLRLRELELNDQPYPPGEPREREELSTWRRFDQERGLARDQ